MVKINVDWLYLWKVLIWMVKINVDWLYLWKVLIWMVKINGDLLYLWMSCFFIFIKWDFYCGFSNTVQRGGVSLMYMYVIGIQECLKEFGRCCNLSIKVGFWLVKSIVMMKVLERRLSKVSLLMIQASAVSKGQFVSRDTLHVSKLEFDCQTCGWKKAPPLSPSCLLSWQTDIFLPT